jgi:hypothetical protein
MTIDFATYLGHALLVAEFEVGYEPIGVVSTLLEADQLLKGDLARRCGALANGEDCPCPEGYKVWNRGEDGTFCVIAEFAK